MRAPAAALLHPALRVEVLLEVPEAKFLNGVARISGVEAPKFDDTESTFPELKARIQKTLDYLASVPNERIDGTEDKEITFPVGRDKSRTMKGEAYLKHFVLPNFYFHLTTAYGLLRHNGVPLGKPDFLGRIA